jgi:hypothetical protein
MKEKGQVNSFLGTLVSTSFLEPALTSTFCCQCRRLEALGYRQLLEAER